MEYMEVKYEVYRFHKWWKNSFIIPMCFEKDLDFWVCTDKIKITKEATATLEKIAYKRDLWEIRNLTYKYVAYDKENK